MGPSKTLNFPNEFITTIPGYPMCGMAQVLVFLPILPEIIERLQLELKITEGQDLALDEKLNDLINEVYTFMLAISSFVSPIIGSYLYREFGKQKTFDIVAGVNIVYAIINFRYNCGFDVYRENEVFRAKVKK